MGLGLGPLDRREAGRAVHAGGVRPRSERGAQRTREAGEAAVKRKHDRGMVMLVLGLAVRMRRLVFCLGKILRRPLLELGSLLRKIGLLRWDRKSRVVVVGEAVAEDGDNRDVLFILVCLALLFVLPSRCTSFQIIMQVSLRHLWANHHTFNARYLQFDTSNTIHNELRQLCQGIMTSKAAVTEPEKKQKVSRQSTLLAVQ